VTLSDISIKNPVFAWMLMFGLILFGGISFGRMGISQMPDIDFPVVNIDVTYEGASPEIMETDVIDVIENAVMSVEGIHELRSTARQGQASVTVELDVNRDVDVALQEVQTKIAQAQRLLPDEIEPPIISKRNPEDFPIMWVAVTSDRPIKDLMVYTRNHLRDRYQTLPGVADVRMGGYVDRAIRIWIDRKKLQALELSIDDVLNTIGREHIEIPGGRIETSKNEFVIRSMGEASTVKELEKLPITSRGGAPVYRKILLGDVADIKDDLDDIRRISRFNGKPTVGLGIMKQRRSNTIAVAEEVRKLTADLQTRLPEGYSVAISHDMTKFVKDSTDELVFTIILSTILTGIVCLVFLGSFSSTFNILLAIPTSIMGSFIFLYFWGFTLNTFTLLALSLAIGIVVDDAIMVMENISRYQEMGHDRVEAAGLGARQITFAAIAATLAVIAIFLPVAFMKGIIGKYFLEFGITITVAVALSLLEALTLTPMRCSQFLQVGSSTGSLGRAVNRAFSSLSGSYGRAIGFILDHRWTVILGSIAFFTASLLFLIPMKKEFVPAQDQSMFIVRIKTSVGSSLEYTDSLTEKAESFVASRGEVLRYFSAVGGFTGGEVNTAMIFVTMKEPDERPVDPVAKRRLNQAEFAGIVRSELNRISKDMKATIQDLSTRGFSATRGYPVEFTVRGTDWQKLGNYSDEIAARMVKSGMMVDVDTGYDAGQPEIQILPDRNAAELRGVSMTSIGNAVSALIGGKKMGKFTDAGHRYDIRVRLKEPERRMAEDIKYIFVRNNRGELVRLSDVVKIVTTSSLLSITRINRERSIAVYASPAPGFSQEEAITRAMKITRDVLPEGYSAELTGSAKTSSESFDSLLFALIIGVIVSYMILGSQFNSYIHPLTILLALPFSFSGAIIALVLTGKSLNIYSFIGLILLMGLVKKNSILLVEFANQLRHEGKSVREALMTACPIRLRPIMMTTLSTVAAAIPPALALGPGAEARIPMAIAVLGGMIVSTLLTLFVVPCAYSLLAGLERARYGK
jgi:hydrophobe/amphiphile efflux-1 (HAE1) family protein